jgi:flavin-binding protein dodecin
MAENKTYKKIEVVGTSEESVSDAIEGAIDKAEESVENLDWFEVDEIRGGLKGDTLTYQVSVEIGFRLE